MIGALVDEFADFRPCNVVMAVTREGLLLSFSKREEGPPRPRKADLDPHGFLIPWSDVTGLRKMPLSGRFVVDTRFGEIKSKSRAYREVYDGIRVRLGQGAG